jgi:hypothetical protein
MAAHHPRHRGPPNYSRRECTLFTVSFWRQAAERAAKSAAQALIGMWALDGANILHAHWDVAFGVAGGAVVLSLLTSIVTVGVGEPNSPSAVEVPPTTPGPRL